MLVFLLEEQQTKNKIFNTTIDAWKSIPLCLEDKNKKYKNSPSLRRKRILIDEEELDNVQIVCAEASNWDGIDLSNDGII